MGRITVFSHTECHHCWRVKGAFDKRGIPYTEINLSLYPEKRSDMLTLTDRLTVPQVFLNSQHVGGAEETMKVIVDEWESNAKHSRALDYYRAEIESKPDPTDARLAKPTTEPLVETPPPPRNQQDDNILIPGPEEKKMSVLELTLFLKQHMPRGDLAYHGKIYKHCFLGSDGVAALMQHFHLDKSEAVQLGKLLQRRKILHHVVNDNHPLDENEFYYRLQPFHQPAVLNSFRVWLDRVDSDNLGLVRRLQKLMAQIEEQYTDSEGQMDYIRAISSQSYDIFEEAVCELQGVALGTMDDNTKLAFCINTYNLMIKYAFLKVGIPQNSVQRSSFFGSVCFNIGGLLFTFNDLEHGILRSNSRPPYGVKPLLSRGDPRWSLTLPEVDCRIHFALNCGAKSCPPVKIFTKHALDEELRIVTQAFCQEDDAVRLQESTNEVFLTNIMKWFRHDFAPSTDKLPHKVVSFLRGEKQATLQRMLQSGKSIKVKFLPYDWGSNASNFKTFGSSALVLNHFSPKALIPN